PSLPPCSALAVLPATRPRWPRSVFSSFSSWQWVRSSSVDAQSETGRAPVARGNGTAGGRISTSEVDHENALVGVWIGVGAGRLRKSHDPQHDEYHDESQHGEYHDEYRANPAQRQRQGRPRAGRSRG